MPSRAHLQEKRMPKKGEKPDKKIKGKGGKKSMTERIYKGK